MPPPHALATAARTAAHALRHDPEALFLALLLLLSGLVHFFGSPLPNPIQALLPRMLVEVWYVELIIGGALRIAGLLAGSPKLDLAGCLLLGTASGVYASAIVYVDGPGWLIAAAVTYALAAACLCRAVTYIGDARRGRGGPDLDPGAAP